MILLLEELDGLLLIPPEFLKAKRQEIAEYSGQIIRHYISKHYCMCHIPPLHFLLHFQ